MRVATAALVVFGGVALVIRFAFGAGVPQLILAVLIAIGPYVYVLTRARGELEAGVLVRAMKARPSRPGGTTARSMLPSHPSTRMVKP